MNKRSTHQDKAIELQKSKTCDRHGRAVKWVNLHASEVCNNERLLNLISKSIALIQPKLGTISAARLLEWFNDECQELIEAKDAEIIHELGDTFYTFIFHSLTVESERALVYRGTFVRFYIRTVYELLDFKRQTMVEDHYQLLISLLLTPTALIDALAYTTIKVLLRDTLYNHPAIVNNGAIENKVAANVKLLVNDIMKSLNIIHAIQTT